MAGPRHRHRRAEERVVAVTADAYRDLELAALAAVAEAVLADLRSDPRYQALLAELKLPP
jgi:hypothetical protein